MAILKGISGFWALTFVFVLGVSMIVDVHGNCKYAGQNSKFAKFANQTQSFPNIASIAMALYKKDFDGMNNLIAINSMRSLSKSRIKNFANRTRPCGCKGGSFPSGHALASFQGASYVQYRYGLKYSVPVYAMALATSYTRVKTKSHYWTDIIGSAVAINLFTYLTVSKFDNNQVSLMPVINSEDKEILFGIKYNF